MANSILSEKSYSFAIEIIRLYKDICEENHEYVLSKQLLKSGTSIGASVREAAYAQSKADFISKLSISLKEANETLYWINLLHDTGYIDSKKFSIIKNCCEEIIRLLTASIKTAKSTLKKP